MKKASFSLIIFFISTAVFSQVVENDSLISNPSQNSKTKQEFFPSFAKNSIYGTGGSLMIETNKFMIGASSGLLNYGRLVFENPKVATYLRSGFGFYLGVYNQNFVFGLQTPLSLDIIFGKKNNHLEVNLGGRYVRGLNIYREEDFSQHNNILPVANVGYRYQKPGRSVILKAAIGTDGINLGIGLGF